MLGVWHTDWWAVPTLRLSYRERQLSGGRLSEMSTTKSATVPVVLLFVLLLVGLGAVGWTQLHNAAEAADYSAHAALTKEILDQLAAMSPGQYPQTLGKLRLTFLRALRVYLEWNELLDPYCARRKCD
jgi:hypothetical protein